MRKHTIEFIRSEFEKEGWILESIEYKNQYQKLDYICPNGHRHNICWNHFKQGVRCAYCSGKAKKLIEFIRSEFAKEGYILLTTKYTNAFKKLDYVCSEGHRHSTTWGNWQQGARCPYCVGQGKLIIEFIRSEFAKENYILLTTEYINNTQKLNYICPNGHRHEITWHDWIVGHRCSFCAIINNSGENHYNYGKRGKDSSGYKHGRCGTKSYNTQMSMKHYAQKKNQTSLDADLEKIDYIYQICEAMNRISEEKYEVDHIKPLSKGGLHHQDNLQILKKNFNCGKNAKWPLTEEEEIKYKGITLKGLEKNGGNINKLLEHEDIVDLNVK